MKNRASRGYIHLKECFYADAVLETDPLLEDEIILECDGPPSAEIILRWKTVHGESVLSLHAYDQAFPAVAEFATTLKKLASDRASLSPQVCIAVLKGDGFEDRSVMTQPSGWDLTKQHNPDIPEFMVHWSSTLRIDGKERICAETKEAAKQELLRRVRLVNDPNRGPTSVSAKPLGPTELT